MPWWSPTLEYSVTRAFKWPWFGGISLLGATLVLVLLVVINVPLSGYETVVIFQKNFNATEFYSWPFRILKPSSPCEPSIFKVGDAFTTNNNFFDWNIDSIIKGNAGDSAISYNGIPLTFCDVTSIYGTGDLPSWGIEIAVIVTCDDMFKMTVKTTFSISFLPGRYSGRVDFFNNGTMDTKANVLYNILALAADDAGGRASRAFVGSNRTTPTIISLRANFDFCPMSLGIAAPCSNQPPKFGISHGAAVYADGSLYPFGSDSPPTPTNNPSVLNADIEQPTYNMLQTVYAAIRVDLGNPSLNNFILNPSALNATTFQKFPVTAYNQDQNSALYNQLHDADANLAINVSGPAQIQTVYQCQIWKSKPLGPLIVSVLVATLSMFFSTWAVFIFTATAFAKRSDRGANRCDGHCPQHRLTDEPSRYELQPTAGSGHHQSLSPTDVVEDCLNT